MIPYKISAEHFPDPVWNLLLLGAALVAGLLLQKILKLILRAFYPQRQDATRLMITRRLALPLNYFLPLVILESLLPFVRLPFIYSHYLDKGMEILLLVSFAFILIRIVKLVEDYFVLHYDIHKTDNLKERKIRTQIHFLRKMMILVIIVVTIAAILLSFESLRKLGAGLLTGVGIGGIIIGFAAQKSLGNLLAGFQIALTQSIRMDDVLVVEGEWGRVEDITLTYVALKIWDERRLILPITYFIEKPFQNWTRTSAEITGSIFLHMDYSLPVDMLRKEFFRLVELSPLWDHRIRSMQVTDARDTSIEIRALMSAKNSSDAFDLRCWMREQLVAFIQEHYPLSLPKIRLYDKGQVLSSRLD